ncbi:MAG: DNA repair protein RecN [Sphingobacteriales bacterium]|nr:MAG: DNA repair protein RecN [Sphingobacteriales bacterium]
MLTHLKIKNFALIKDLEIDFRKGFNIITGETGTGKSIILGALGLILGNRADSSSLYNNHTKCIIEGRFYIAPYKLESFFERNDLDWEEQTLLRREIAPGGKSRAFINDTPVNLNILKELGENLIDIHSQHQTLKLTSAGFQLSLVDAFARHKPLLDDYAKLFRQYKKSVKELELLKEKAAQANKDYDYFLFQLNELTTANLIAGELEMLEEEMNLLSHAEIIAQRLQSSVFALYDSEQSIHSQLSEIKKQLSSISALNPVLKQLYERIDASLIEIKDIYAEADDFQQSISVDNKRMEEVNNRLQLLNNLLNKHHFGSVQELIIYAEELQTKVGSTETLEDEIKLLEMLAKNQLEMVEHKAAEISKNRHAQVNIVAENAMALLKEVGIADAKIVIKLQYLQQLNETGKDGIDILFSANKGREPESVGQVASGGELSRLMLCFKYMLADSIFLPTIVFDEIDTGVSGEVSIKIGQILKRMSAKHQVMCITHQPQIAAMGAHHYVVYKITGEDFTETNIRSLQQTDRISEIAKMIAGHKPSALAIENAKELLSTYNQ